MLRTRQLIGELMDDPALDAAAHARALAGLERLNIVSRSAAIVWPAIAAAAARRPRETLRVLDLATGGGDVPLAVARRAARSGIQLELHGLDKSSTAIDVAQARAREAGAPPVRFSVHDVIRDPLPQDYHVVMSSLFLHHLPAAEAEGLLAAMGQATLDLVLASDLRRTLVGYAMAWVACRTFTRSPVVRVDGPRSVEAAFTGDEIRALAQRAGLGGAQLSSHWPQRFLLSWRKPW